MRQNHRDHRVLNPREIATYSIATAIVVTFMLTATAQAGTYSDAVLADNPIAYYRLDETNGTTADNLGTAGSAIDGTYVNIPGADANNTSDYGQPGPRPSTFPGFEADNNSVFFDPEDGTTSTSTTSPRVEVSVPDDSGTHPLVITGALTLEAWIKPGEDLINPSNNEGIASRYRQNQDGNASRSYVMYYDSGTDGSRGTPDGTPGLGLALSTTGGFQSANSYEFGAGDDLPNGEWSHVAVVYDPGVRVAAYVNGVKIGEVTTGVTAGPLWDGRGDFWIGQQFTYADEWNFEGNIDEVAVYDQALSDEQIAAHFAAAPEPASCAISLVGLACLLMWRRRGVQET